MTGTQLRKKILAAGYTIAKMADEMGISEQALYSKLKTQDVKVSLLQDLARVTNKSVGFWLGIEASSDVLNEPSPSYNNEWKDKYLHCMEENRELRIKLEERGEGHPAPNKTISKPQLKQPK